MPSPRTRRNVEEIQRTVDNFVTRVYTSTANTDSTFTMTASASNEPTLSPEETTMRTETRDTFCRQLDALIAEATRINTSFKTMPASRITERVFEEQMNTLIMRVDNAYQIATPALARAAAGADEDDDADVTF